MAVDRDICDQVVMALRRIVRAIDVHSKTLARDYKLTGPQLLILREIVRLEQTTLSELARRASLSNATITGIVDRLERRGMVERCRSTADRRQVLVRATENGAAIFQSAPPLLQEQFSRELSALQSGEQAEILGSLEKIAEMMEPKPSRAGPVLANNSFETTGVDLMTMPGNSGTGAQSAGGGHRVTPEQGSSTTGAAKEITIHEVHGPDEYPDWINADQLAAFLHESLKPYHDPVDQVRTALDKAFEPMGEDRGFILIAEADRKPVGALVILPTGMRGYIPPFILLFVAVDPAGRGQGLGRRLVERAIEKCPGDVKLHVEYDNPAKRLYERIGVTSKYAEMRYKK